MSVMDLFNELPPAYRWPVQFCLFTTLATYIASVITANVSQVDRLWTFLPTIYAAYYALLPLWPNQQPFFLCPFTPKELGWAVARDFSPRALLMFVLVFIWMCRLSYNTHRRGLFNLKDEDYRWAVLRKQLPPWLFQVVNLTFISGMQNVLLLFLSLPIKTASTVQPHVPLARSDYLLAALALVVLVFEFTADNQQWAYQAYKHAFLAGQKGKGKEGVDQYDEYQHWPGARLKWTPADARRGFITRGLWAYSRHPNFACEQTFWWIITLIPLLSPSTPNLPKYHLSDLPSLSRLAADLPRSLYPLAHVAFECVEMLFPAIALSALFLASTRYTEAISVSKYPEAYRAYRERVGMFGFSRTWEKGLGLSWRGRRQAVEALVWGGDEKEEKND